MEAGDGFGSAFLVPLVELWEELDELLGLFDGDPARLAVGVEILRLELELLDAACTRLAQRRLLTHAQSLRIRVLLDEVRWRLSPPELAELAFPSVEAAQDRIYEEVLRLIAEQPLGSARVH